MSNLTKDPGAGLTEWKALREQAAALVKSGFLPRALDTPEKALAVMLTGRELGIGPMQALRTIHIIDGRPTLSADLIAGLVHQRCPGALLQVVESTNDHCTVHAARPGQEKKAFVWTMSDAQRAGLTGKTNWQKYPRAMLKARAVADAARSVFPDAVMGLYTPDELGAVTTEEGEPTVAAPPAPALPTRQSPPPPAPDPLRLEPPVEESPRPNVVSIFFDRIAQAQDGVALAAVAVDIKENITAADELRELREAWAARQADLKKTRRRKKEPKTEPEVPRPSLSDPVDDVPFVAPCYAPVDGTDSPCSLANGHDGPHQE